jgi:hypothetical protein
MYSTRVWGLLAEKGREYVLPEAAFLSVVVSSVRLIVHATRKDMQRKSQLETM